MENAVFNKYNHYFICYSPHNKPVKNLKKMILINLKHVSKTIISRLKIDIVLKKTSNNINLSFDAVAGN